MGAPTLNAHLFATGRTQAMQVMSMTREITVPAGTVIYRFYDMLRAPVPMLGAEGAWWLEYEHSQAIKHFGQRHGYSLGYSARLFAAILYEWSEVNARIACCTTTNLSAWKGRGKQVESKGRDARDQARMTPMQGPLEVYQLCIPGLEGQDSLASQALRMQGHGLAR
jgi:hypothetical protein